MEAFRLEVPITVEGIKKFQSDLNSVGSTVTRSANSISGTLAKFGKTLAGAFAVGAIVKFGKTCVDVADDMGAQFARAEATFGKFGKTATDMFERVSKTSTVMSSRLEKVGVKAFQQFIGAGIKANDALADTEIYLRTLTTIAADMNMGLEETSEYLRQFINGAERAGYSINLFTSEEEKNKVAVSLYRKEYEKLTDAQKQSVMLTIANQVAKQSQSYTDAAANLNNWSTVVDNFTEKWKLFLTAIGNPLIQTLTPAVRTLGDVIDGARGKIETATKWMDQHAETVDKVKKAVALLGVALVTLGGTFAGLAVIQKVIGLFGLLVGALTSPLAIVAALGAAMAVLAGVIINLYQTNETFRDIVDSAWNTVKTVVTTVIDAVKGVIEGFSSFIGEHGDTIKLLVDSTINSVRGIISTVLALITGDWETAWNNIYNFISNMWLLLQTCVQAGLDGIRKIIDFTGMAERAKEFGQKIVQAFIDGITGMAGKAKTVIQGFGGKVWGKLTGWMGKGSGQEEPTTTMPALASGGVVTMPTTALIGESGPEAVVPLEDNSGWISKLASAVVDALGNVGGKVTSAFSGGNIVDGFKTLLSDATGAIKESSLYKTFASMLGLETEQAIADAGDTAAQAVPAQVEKVKVPFKEKVKNFLDDYESWQTARAESYWTKLSNVAGDIVDKFNTYVGGLTSAISGYQNQLLQGEVDSAQEYYDQLAEGSDEYYAGLKEKHAEEIAQYAKEYASGAIGYEEYIARKKRSDSQYVKEQNAREAEEKKAEEELNQKKDKQARQAFENEKKTSIANALINGALAITKAYSQLGVWATAVLPALAATTALQVATIGKQEYVSQYLAEGGVVDKPTRAVIGEDGAEAVIPLENNTGWMDKVADRITERQAGRDGSLRDVLHETVVQELYQFRLAVVDMLQQVIELEGKDVRLDTGELVGALAPAIDNALGRRSAVTARGV